MKFGEVKKIALLGGGIILKDVADCIRENNIEFEVFSSKRHLDEKIKDQMTLQDVLEEKNIVFHDVPNINKYEPFFNFVDENTVALSFSSAWIIKQKVIDALKGKIVNKHSTYLPLNRGGGGFSWTIMMGDRNGASTLHLIDAGIDTGDIVMRKEVYYPESCKRPIDFENYRYSNDLDLVKSFLSSIIQQEDILLTQQDESKSSYWPRLNTNLQGYIDWSWNASEIYHFICAFDEPYKGASTFVNKKRLFLKNCELAIDEKINSHPFQSGLVFRKHDDVLFVIAKGGVLKINNVCDEDGNVQNEFIQLGDRLFTPADLLDNALKNRIIYTPKGFKQPT